MPTEGGARLILASHDLGPTPSGGAAEQVYWLPFATFRDLAEDLMSRTAGTGVAVEFTSDDGYVSDYTHLLPWLVETGRTATFFVPAGFLDRPGRLDRAQLREMAGLGMHIGCHGYDHLDWTTLDDAGLRRETADARALLEDVVGRRVDRVAPPFGRYNGRVYRTLVRQRFAEIHSARGGYCLPAGRLRTRAMVQGGRGDIGALLALGSRAPRPRDRLRCVFHELQARLR